MQEHIGKKRSENGCPQFIQTAYIRQPYLIGDQSIIKYHELSLLAVQHKNLKKENQRIDKDQQPVYYGKTAGGDGITQGYQDTSDLLGSGCKYKKKANM